MKRESKGSPGKLGVHRERSGERVKGDEVISLEVEQKPAGNKRKHIEGQCTETSGSAQEHNWVVGSVMFGFRRNPDVAGNRGSGGWKCVRPIAIDYCTVAGTAGADARETEDRRGQTVGVCSGLRWPYGDTRARRLRDETRGAD